MATVVRAEAVITAQNKLRPGLASAARDLNKFAAAQKKLVGVGGLERMERISGLMRGAAAALAAGVSLNAMKQASLRYADIDRSMTRIALTGDATSDEAVAGLGRLRQVAVDAAMPLDKVKSGLDTLAAAGVEWKDSMAMMTPVVRTAQASGAAVEDIANSSLAATRHLGIAVKDLQLAQDMMAMGGQLGQFELRDMARYLPSMAPAARAVGIEGTRGLAQMVAMLQIIRQGTGTAEEAASSAANIFQKMESEQTATNFEKFGVNLRKEMARARKEGRDLITTLVEMTQKATKGDLSKIPQIFTDMEFARGMRALLAGFGQMGDLVGKISDGAGTVDKNLKRVLGDGQASLDRFSESADRARSAVGGLTLLFSAPWIDAFAGGLQRAADQMERILNAGRKGGPGAALSQISQDARGSVAEELSKHRGDMQFAEDEMLLKTMRERIAEVSKSASVNDAYLEELRGKPQNRARRDIIASMEEARRRRYHITDEEASAWSRNQIDRIGPAAPDFAVLNKDEIDSLQDFAREARRAQNAQAVVESRRRKPGIPLPPQRPRDLTNPLAGIDVAPLDDTIRKSGDAMKSVSELGTAGRIAGSSIAEGLQSANAAAEALGSSLDRLAEKARSMPGINMPINSGLNTGKSMPELR